jgi:hypothetical protein
MSRRSYRYRHACGSAIIREDLMPLKATRARAARAILMVTGLVSLSAATAQPAPPAPTPLAARSGEQDRDGLHLTLTYCAPPGYRAAFIRLAITNRGTEAVQAAIGLKSSFGSLARVTYVPVALRGERTIGPAPWVDPGEVYSYITNDTRFAWAIVHLARPPNRRGKSGQSWGADPSLE